MSAKREPDRYLVIVAALTFLCLAAGIASGAPVTQGITYQGKLTDAAGNPLTGTFSVKCSLYEAATGGTAIASSTQSVTCTNGLFTTALASEQKYFDGRALGLGVRAGTDPEMTPRQEIRPVPYALSLRPGAVINATTDPSLKVINTGSDTGNLIVGTTGVNSMALFASAQGQKSPAVSAMSQNDIGVSGIGKTGAYFTTSTAGSGGCDLRPGMNVSTAYKFYPGTRIVTTGQNSYGGEADTAGPGSYGVNAYTTGDSSDAVRSLTTGPASNGYKAVTYRPGSRGPDAVTIGDNSEGIIVSTQGEASDGVSITTKSARSRGIFIVTEGLDSNGMHISTEDSSSDGVLAQTKGPYSVAVKAATHGMASRAFMHIRQVWKAMVYFPTPSTPAARVSA